MFSGIIRSENGSIYEYKILEFCDENFVTPLSYYENSQVKSSQIKSKSDQNSPDVVKFLGHLKLFLHWLLFLYVFRFKLQLCVKNIVFDLTCPCLTPRTTGKIRSDSTPAILWP